MSPKPPAIGFADIASLANAAHRAAPPRPEPHPDQDRRADIAAAAAGFVPRDPNPPLRRVKAPADPRRRIDFPAPADLARRFILFCNAGNLTYADALKVLMDHYEGRGGDT